MAQLIQIPDWKLCRRRKVTKLIH